MWVIFLKRQHILSQIEMIALLLKRQWDSKSIDLNQCYKQRKNNTMYITTEKESIKVM